MEYFRQLQQQGEIENAEPFMLEPYGGDLGGFLLVRGEPAKLVQLRLSEAFQRMSQRLALVVDRFGVLSASSGEEVAQNLPRYEREVKDLAG